jgi:hypothetical protein
MGADDTGMHLRPLPRIGHEFGRFIIEKELPRGGQARVYRAWQTDLQRPVALKLLPSSYAADADTLTRFRREIENVARISHPNIVRVFEAGELDGNPYFTMDFIEGRDAETMLKRGPMEPDEAATIIEAIARALAEAHGQGIVHRDIKPGNIIVRRDGTPVLTDFGLAQDLTHSDQLTQTGISMGTPAYMAPEQARGERNRVGVKSDIYSLGATLYTLLTAKRPAEGGTAYELMLKVAESQGPHWPRYAIEGVPPDLRAIVEMATAPDPAKRYESAAAFADDLERYLHGEWVIARSRGKLARVWLRTRRYVPVAAVIVIALGLAGGMVYTGLNPGFGDNGESIPLDRKTLLENKPTDAELVALFDEGGTWIQEGGTVRRGVGGELVLARTGAKPLFISPREPACWGDFTLQSDLRVKQIDGPVELLVGMTESRLRDDAAYAVILGAGSRDRVELQRLGEPILSSYRAGARPLLEPNTWYRANIVRNGQIIEFSLFEAQLTTPIVRFSFNDIVPAFAESARELFAVRSDTAELSLRAVSVSHRETQQPVEMLFSVGQFTQAERRITARLATPLPAVADAQVRNARANLLFLRALCRERTGRAEAALADCSAARSFVTEPALNTRIFMLTSLINTARNDDDAALAQLGAARLSADQARELSSWVLHSASSRGASLRELEPERALRYYDFVSAWALGSPALVCDALHQGAMVRLRLAELHPERAEELQGDALNSLQRIEGTYQRFSGTYANAMEQLFWMQRTRRDAAAMPRIADWLAASVGGYGVDDAALIKPLVYASWFGRLSASPGDLSLARKGWQWLDAAKRAGAEPEWLLAQQALAAEERPELYGDSAARRARWQDLDDAVRASESLDESNRAVLVALAECFLAIRDAARGEDNLRRALRRDRQSLAAHWFANAGADAFADYCVALHDAGIARERAAAMLQKAAASPLAGDLKLLQGRETAWLPLPR